jgi:hypothetical protein
MTSSLHSYPVLFLGMSAAMLVPAACSTQQISADPVVIPETTPSEDNGALQIGFAPHEATFDEQQANAATQATPFFHVFFDGQQLVWSSDFDGSLQPFVVGEAGSANIAYLPAGSHHFEVRAPDGGSIVFGGDGAIAAGAMTELFLFGPAGAIEGRFISYPTVAAAGTAHVVLINLVRSGQRLEAVKCVGDTSHCTPLSSPLALGETFVGDFPLDATQDWPNGRFIVSNGAALGYRQVPTAAVSDPPVLPLSYGVAPVAGSMPPGATLVAAPIYMSPRGDVQESF